MALHVMSPEAFDAFIQEADGGEALAQLVSEHMQTVPPGWALSAAQVAATVGNARKGQFPWAAHYPGSPGFAAVGGVAVAEGGALAAAAQWARPDPGDAGWDPAYRDRLQVLWLAADPRRADAAPRLIQAVIEHGEQLGCRAIDVTGRFAFGAGWFGLPSTWAHLVEPLLEAGFQVRDRWVLITAEIECLPDPPRQAFAAGLRPVWRVDEAAREWDLVARHGPDEVGSCQAWGLPPGLAGCPDFNRWITLEGVEVEPAYRRQGLGRHLVLEQLRFHFQRGVRRAMLWTMTNNTAARALCRALGFQVGPECGTLRKEIG